MNSDGRVSIGINRRVDDLGRIVLPVEMRRVLAVRPGDAMEIAMADGAIVLRKVESRCVFCDTTGDDLVAYRRKRICAACARDVATGRAPE